MLWPWPTGFALGEIEMVSAGAALTSEVPASTPATIPDTTTTIAGTAQRRVLRCGRVSPTTLPPDFTAIPRSAPPHHPKPGHGAAMPEWSENTARPPKPHGACALR